jgi:hypothetical protein
MPESKIKKVLKIIFYGVPFLAAFIFLGETFVQWGLVSYVANLPMQVIVFGLVLFFDTILDARTPRGL